MTTVSTEPVEGGTAPPWATVRLLSVAFASATQAQVIWYVLDELRQARGGWIITANLDILRRLQHDAAFAHLARGADLIVADGMPLVWASHLRGTPLPERVAGSTMVSELAEAAAKDGRSLYLLGGNEGAAEAAADVLQNRYADLVIAGVDCPPMGFEHDEAEMQRIRAAVVNASPDIVYVALGSPKQEQLIETLRHALPRTWWIGVGISLSFLSGEVRRAPSWVQRAGLEWVHRLIQEPRRLGRRYLLEGIPFAVRLFGWAGFSRLMGRRHEHPSKDR